jgi:glycosyltransferase involved in cell wall biosynthesis
MSRISIISATYNADKHLKNLIHSLETQTDLNFEWVIADGKSTDSTLELIERAKKKIRIKIDSREDFGIYDALNRAIKMAEGDYYIVMGADDELYPDAVATYRSIIEKEKYDMLVAPVMVLDKVYRIKGLRWEWLYAQSAFIAAHAVGMCINKNLHEKYGYYSRNFPIAADQLFIQKCIHGGARIKEMKLIAGKFGANGVSSIDKIGCLMESYRVQIIVGKSFFVQSILLFIRLIKYWIRNILLKN